jgi:diaminohydroxyphosphoribosylaminopyrimidine deaminase/5-amino-6-(5-phosphoribosylamino)uracil reductase
MQLAEQARGKCSPNPFVGAVIVKQDKIIGEGYTQAYGSDHAEVQAIKNCSKNCSGADMYVTLEPCSHYGKTPPCALAIIDSGIKQVYIGIKDPNPLVSGQGINLLSAAGIAVKTGLLADLITRQLEYYLTYITQNRPFIFLKSALSLDGRIAAQDGSARWISCEASRARTHELRREADAVLTGIGTVLSDDPMLNVRLSDPGKQPLRVVLDSQLRIPLKSALVSSARDFKTLVFTSMQTHDKAKISALAAAGVEVCPVGKTSSGLDLHQVLAELKSRQIQVVMLEAGSAVNTSFLAARLVDKLFLFQAPLLLGGERLAWNRIGVDNIAQALKLAEVTSEPCGTDTLISAYPVYDADGH